MKTLIVDAQKEFEYKVCKILGFDTSNSIIMQRDKIEQMILDDFSANVSHLDVLSGTIAHKRKDKSFLLVVTKDSEVNHVDYITPKMIDLLISSYVIFKGGNKCLKNYANKVIFATNIPIEIHSSKAKELKENYNFHIESIGYSFCLKHSLEHTPMY